MDAKKKLGRPSVDNEPVMIRMPTEMIAAIDQYRRTQQDLPSRPEVIRRVVAAWLATLQEQDK